MTMKRKKDKSQPKDDKDYDYESLKVFLTAESAMRYNPDKKPINKYKLSLLAQFVKGHFQVIVLLAGIRSCNAGYQCIFHPTGME